MDVVFIILAVLLIIVGIIGCFVPVLPGPPLAWLGLLLGFFSKYCHLNIFWLIFTFILAAGATVMDFILPGMITKVTKGSKAASIGSTIGVIIGLFIGPWGVIFGPFVGALLGELIHNKWKFGPALKAAWGAFLGFLAGIGIKLITVLQFLWIFIFSFIIG
ncbi:MAG: DUF456 domain-containing protein [Treponema sp.]|nr:DUF456 domain-containing protein [Treponema sp.]